MFNPVRSGWFSTASFSLPAMPRGPAQLGLPREGSGPGGCPQGRHSGFLWPFRCPTEEFSRTGEPQPGCEAASAET